jgi:hypothetical protein
VIEKTSLVMFCMVHWSVNEKWTDYVPNIFHLLVPKMDLYCALFHMETVLSNSEIKSMN